MSWDHTVIVLNNMMTFFQRYTNHLASLALDILALNFWPLQNNAQNLASSIVFLVTGIQLMIV